MPFPQAAAARECPLNKEEEQGLQVGPVVQPTVPTGTTVGAGGRAREPAGVTVRDRVGPRPGSGGVLASALVQVLARGLVRGRGLDMALEVTELVAAGSDMELVRGIQMVVAAAMAEGSAAK